MHTHKQDIGKQICKTAWKEYFANGFYERWEQFKHTDTNFCATIFLQGKLQVGQMWRAQICQFFFAASYIFS